MITDTEYAAALAAGRLESEYEVHAHAVRYVPDRDAIEIITNRNAGVLIPREWIGALQDVPAEDLDKLEVWPNGSAVELEKQDIHISVHGLAHCDITGDPAFPGCRYLQATSEA